MPRSSYQASKLERIVAEASDLIRQTGHFYDRYSETHKNAGGDKNGDDKASEKIPGGNSSLLGNDATAGRHQNRGVATAAGQSDRCEGRHRAASAGAAMERSFGANGSSPGNPPPGVFSPQQLSAGGHQPWRGREDSGNCLDRTLEHRHGVGAGPALRELDRACYSLLESNAQLCLRLQGLGLEYAGLSRQLLASGAKEVLVWVNLSSSCCAASFPSKSPSTSLTSKTELASSRPSNTITEVEALAIARSAVTTAGAKSGTAPPPPPLPPPPPAPREETIKVGDIGFFAGGPERAPRSPREMLRLRREKEE
ncbi:unnamed protein product [Ectocarpus sp. CCAP 1310/34]|nr:unnamed protein product [Ectocarpus sp. CCAP 1310/34]